MLLYAHSDIFVIYFTGRGVFTTKDFHAGDFLLEYAGELISHRQALKREQEYSETDGSFLYFFRHNNKVLWYDDILVFLNACFIFKSIVLSLGSTGN